MQVRGPYGESSSANTRAIEMRTRYAIYCDILYRGLINIRMAGHAGDSERCHVEADHLHNIPELLGQLDNEALHEFYWETMRPSYLSQCKPVVSQPVV